MAALLYQPRQSSRVWLALIASVLLHCAAVALAAINRNPIPEAGGGDDSYPEIPIEFVPDSDPPPPEIEIPEVPPLVTSIDESPFHEDAVPPPPLHPQRRFAPLVRPATAKSGSDLLSATKAFAINAPRPEYPYEARRGRITGEGVAIMSIDPSGNVISVTMSKSTGSPVLDQATLAGFRRWRFQAGTPPMVRCPITYTLTGSAY